MVRCAVRHSQCLVSVLKTSSQYNHEIHIALFRNNALLCIIV